MELLPSPSIPGSRHFMEEVVVMVIGHKRHRGGSLWQGKLSGSKDGNLAEYYYGIAVPVSGTLRGGRGAFVLFAMLLII